MQAQVSYKALFTTLKQKFGQLDSAVSASERDRNPNLKKQMARMQKLLLQMGAVFRPSASVAEAFLAAK